MNNKWIPVSSGEFPADNETVYITFIGCRSGKPRCDGVAYRASGTWCWNLDDSECNVVITAWKPCGEPYRGKENV